MQERPNYMKLAWGDVRSSQGWLAKCAILGALCLIPVFGQVVLFGYAYGWARDVAWGVREPLPRRVFGNEDGRLYSRGFYAFVLFFVCSLVPFVASMVLAAVTGMHGALFSGFWSGHGMVPLAWFSSGMGLVTFVLTVAVSLAAFMFGVVGSVRISIYDRMSAGFQFGKVWAMMRRDARGVRGILGRALLAEVLVAVASSVAFILLTIVVTFFGVLFFGALAESGATASASASAGFAIMLLVYVGLALLAYAAVTALVLAASACVSLTVARAAGLWCYQFDVASWRGQDDPLPFESRVG